MECPYIYIAMILSIDTKWLEAISEFNDTMRLALLDGMFIYLEGGSPSLGKDAMVVFSALKPFLDEVRDKRTRLAERSRANGKKGGRKARTNDNKEPNKPTGFSGLKYEDCLKLPEYQDRSDKLRALDGWMKKYVDYIYKHFEPLTQREFDCLHPKYSSEQICDTLLQIENRKDLRKKYKSLYRTLLNWMKRNYGDS